MRQKSCPLSQRYALTAPPKGEPSLASPIGGDVIASSDDRGGALKKGGSQRGERRLPPLELNYIKPSPSRASEGTAFTVVWAREGG